MGNNVVLKKSMLSKAIGFDDIDIFEDLEDFDFGDRNAIYNLQLADPAAIDSYQRLARRELLWNGAVDESIISLTIYILKWNAQDKGKPVEERQPIKILINSDGGDLNSVMQVIDTIKVSKTPVITIGLGKVCSAGGLLLMAGHKRYIFKNTICLIHDGYTMTGGTTGKVLDNMKFTGDLEDRTKEFILSNTKITEKQYNKNYRRDWFMFSDEMVEYGVADKIIDDIDLIV